MRCSRAKLLELSYNVAQRFGRRRVLVHNVTIKNLNA